jgi:hypothetical protein
MGFRQVSADELDQYPAYKSYFQDDFSAFKVQPLIALDILKTLV